MIQFADGAFVLCTFPQQLNKRWESVRSGTSENNVSTSGQAGLLLGNFLFFVAFSLLTGLKIDVEGFLPIFPYSGRELIYPGEKRSDLPHILFGEDTVPGGHPCVTDASPDRKEDVPLRIVWRIGNQIGDGRIEILGQSSGLPVKSAMTKGAVHIVDLHAVDQILIARRKRIGQAGSVAPHGGVERSA